METHGLHGQHPLDLVLQLERHHGHDGSCLLLPPVVLRRPGRYPGGSDDLVREDAVGDVRIRPGDDLELGAGAVDLYGLPRLRSRAESSSVNVRDALAAAFRYPW